MKQADCAVDRRLQLCSQIVIPGHYSTGTLMGGTGLEREGNSSLSVVLIIKVHGFDEVYLRLVASLTSSRFLRLPVRRGCFGTRTDPLASFRGHCALIHRTFHG